MISISLISDINELVLELCASKREDLTEPILIANIEGKNFKFRKNDLVDFISHNHRDTTLVTLCLIVLGINN